LFAAAAGVPLLEIDGQAVDAGNLVSIIGGFTALLAALIAITQADLKRVLAYSTVSQLGYMFLAAGTTTLLGYTAGMFHLFTHAFFKALLFLGAGSVMHAMGGVIDIRYFGGLKRLMPVTRWTFLIGCLALAGVVPLAGFWSKDAILASASGNMPAFLAIAAVTFLTAYYMSRLFVVAFLGEPRSEHASHAHESPRVMTVPLVLLAIPACIAGLPFVASNFIKVPEHEGSPLGAIAVSLIAFAAGAVSGFYLYKNKNKDGIDIPRHAAVRIVRQVGNTLYVSALTAAESQPSSEPITLPDFRD
jgi:NADH-quinone oxidoreductase subunit L